MRIKKSTLKKALIFLVFLALISGFLLVSSGSKISGASTSVQKYFTGLTGYDAQVTKMTKEKGKYSANLQINGQTVSKSYDDGKIKLINLWLQYYDLFKGCMDEKGIKIFVDNNQASIWQLSVLPLLGRDASKYVINCNTDPKTCKDMGVSLTPSILYNGYVYPGPKIPKSFMATTDCIPANYAVVVGN